MRKSPWIAGAAALLLAVAGAGAGHAEPYYAANGVDFVVPADELDAAAVSDAAVHAGFLPLRETDPRVVAGRAAEDHIYEIWELPSHKVATITLTHVKKSNSFAVSFVAKDPSRHHDPLTGEACKRWLKFSGALRLAFGPRVSRFRFRAPQCEP
ncbi:MAG TPA: hypothetical protein VG889_18080 [Rhizomicrobium sp.]|nr:hypothetical protein [Rhizomicrobium sp.]